MLSNRSAFVVGLISFAMVIAISILLIWKSGIALRVKGVEYVARMESIGGLLNGAEVRYRGLKVGRITKISPNPEDIRAFFRIKQGIEIPLDSRVKVTFDGLIGEKYLLILPNESTNEMAAHGAIFDGEAAVGIADFVEVGTENLNHLKDILNSFRSIFTSDDVRVSMKKAILSLESITKNLEKLSGDLNKISENNQLNTIQMQVKDLMDNLYSTSSAINKISEKVNTNIMSDQNVTNISDTFNNLAQLSDQMNQLFGSDSSDASGALNTVRGLSKMKLYPNGSFMHSIENIQTTTYLDLIMDFQDYYVLTGVTDRSSDTLKLQNLQYGRPLTDRLSARVGLFYEKPGLAMNYLVMENMDLGLEIYDINKVKLDFYTYLLFNKNISGFMNVKNNTDHNWNDYSIGIKYYFSGFKR